MIITIVFIINNHTSTFMTSNYVLYALLCYLYGYKYVSLTTFVLFHTSISIHVAGLNRRQSFAKFHPMTLEPPITKVIFLNLQVCMYEILLI